MQAFLLFLCISLKIKIIFLLKYFHFSKFLVLTFLL